MLVTASLVDTSSVMSLVLLIMACYDSNDYNIVTDLSETVSLIPLTSFCAVDFIFFTE